MLQRSCHAPAQQSCSMPGAMGRLTIVVPVLNEAAIIVAALQALALLRAGGAEIVVADGGSCDCTARLAEPFADRVITVRRGRAAAMNAGAALGAGDALLFLHADTTLPGNADRLIDEARARTPSALRRHRPHDQSPLAPDRRRHRRPGDLCDARSVRGGRWLPRPGADGGHRALAAAQAPVPAILHRHAGRHFGPALGAKRRDPHHPADVAAAAFLLPWRPAGGACPALRRAQLPPVQPRPAPSSG